MVGGRSQRRYRIGSSLELLLGRPEMGYALGHAQASR